MSKSNKNWSVSKNAAPTARTERKLLAPAAIVLMLGSAAAIFFYPNQNRETQSSARASIMATSGNPTSAPAPNTMKIAQAVMVTVELDFGGKIPSIAEALQQVERGYSPDDGVGRTFSILDAYGEPTADGNRLHLSMHVSSEKAGVGFLRFKKTGATLWQSRIGNPGDPPAAQKTLMIYLSNGAGGNYVLDGGRGGDSVLNVFLQNSNQKARDVWPDGAEREVTFIYSACGCPVKVMVKRQGDRTRRTKETPVIFPDDPDAVRTIATLMKW
jgi:hypothetical protein